MSGEFIDNKERLITDERRKKIATFISDVLKPAKKTLDEFEIQSQAITEFESRDYQLSAWEALQQARESGADRGLIHLATGLGKTSIAVFDYAMFRNERLANGETARGLFVVHQDNILDQANKSFAEALPAIKRVRSMSGRFDPSADMTFATFQFLSLNAKSIPADTFDYIIYDEAHHIGAESYKKVVEYFNPVFQLGLTATPERMDEKRITDHFGEAIYSKTLPEGIAEGYLANVHYRLMLDKETKQLLQDGLKPKNMTELNNIFKSQPKPENVIEEIKATQQGLCEKTGLSEVKTIIFCADIEQADNIADLMGGASYHSLKGDVAKDEILSKFRKNGLETITVKDMFNEGIDIPEARLLVFLRTTQSKTIFEQQLGRGLRKIEDKTSVDVLDFVANAERIRLVRELANEMKKCRVGHGNNNSSGAGGELIISAEESDFDFDEQIIDILKLYDYFIEEKKNRADWSEFDKDAIIVLADELSPGEPIRSDAIRKLSREGKFPHQEIIQAIFGSITEFHRARGFEVKDHPLRKDWSDWSKDDIIDRASDLSPEKPITKRELNAFAEKDLLPSSFIIKKEFGSVSLFHEACGFDVKQKINWSQYPNQYFIDTAKKISPDVPLTVYDMEDLENFPTSIVIKARFGSITKFQKACGFEVVSPTPWSKKDMDEIINCALLLNPQKAFAYTAIREYNRQGLLPNPEFITKKFGSIEDFNKKCGLI